MDRFVLISESIGLNEDVPIANTSLFDKIFICNSLHAITRSKSYVTILLQIIIEIVIFEWNMFFFKLS